MADRATLQAAADSRASLGLVGGSAQELVQNMRVDKTECWVLERPWKRAHYAKAQFRPETNSAFITRGHQVELHRAIPEPYCLSLGVLAHSSGNAFSARLIRDDISAIAHMSTWSVRVRLQV